LTPHHEVHAAALHAIVDTVTCDWKAGKALAARAEAAAEANVETPCAFNWRTLAMCALAHGELGDEREAHRLEERAQEIGQRGGPYSPEAALLRLALLRSDVEATTRLLAILPARGGAWDVDAAAARLDALVALGEHDRVEEAAPWLDVRSYTRPFALRALGVARGERALIERARTEFAHMGLAARADETKALL